MQWSCYLFIFVLSLYASIMSSPGQRPEKIFSFIREEGATPCSEMETFQVLIAVVFLIINIQFSHTQTYIGCHPRNPSSRQFIANPGNYDKRHLTVDVCSLKCGNIGYPYAGLTQGKLCLCANALNTGAVAESFCAEPCTGNPAEKCGGHLYYSVYQTPQILTGFQITAPAFLEAYAPSTVSFSILSGLNVQYSGQVHGDDSPEFSPTTATSVQQYVRKPGTVVMVATATDSNGNVMKDSVSLKVQTKIKNIVLTCPDQVIGQVQFDCYLHIAMGTHMNVNVDMKDGTIKEVRTPDTRSYTTGQASGAMSAEPHPGNFLFLLPEHTIKYNGTLVALDFISDIAGDAYIQVYRPYCGSSMKFCQKSYSCINENFTCSEQPLGNHWKYMCGAGTEYSIGRQRCVNMADNNLIPDPVVQDWNSTDFQNFELVSELVFSFTNGRNFYQVPDADMLTVKPGDMIAVKENTGRFALLNGTDENYEFYYNVDADPNWSSRGSNGYRLQVTPSVFKSKHAIKAFFIKPITIKIRHTYDFLQEAYLNVTAMAENHVTVPAATSVQLVEVQVVITNVTVEAVYAVATNTSTDITVPFHPGSKPVYTFDFGDGQRLVTTSSTVNHTYTESGIYVITLKAENAISSMTAMTYIIVQDTIQNLTASPEVIATVFGESTSISWNISQGTNVTYTLTMGDSMTYILEYPFESVLNCIAMLIEPEQTTEATTDVTVTEIKTAVSCNNTSTSNSTNNNNSTSNSTDSTDACTTEIVTTTTTPATTTTPKPLLPCNGTSEEMIGHISHLYEAPDWYDFKITATNLISSVTFNLSIPVQIPIQGFYINATDPITFGTSRQIFMSVTEGSHIDHVLALNGSVLNISQFTWESKTGNGIIASDNYAVNGLHILEGNVTNLVSPIITYHLEVWVDYPITNLTMYIDHLYIPVGNDVTFEVGMYWCSRFNATYNFDDDSEESKYYSDLLVSPQTFSKTHFFGFPGLYSVNFTLFNPVDFYFSSHDIYVQYAVKNVTVTVLTPIRIEDGHSSGLFTLDLNFLGGVPLPTMASHLIDFKDGFTLIEPFEPFEPFVPFGPLEVTTEMECNSTNCTTTTSATTTMTESSTTASNVTEPNIVEVTQDPNIAEPFKLIIDHNYTLSGTYNVSINISNLVSHMFFHFLIDVDKPIHNLNLTPSIIHVPIRTDSVLNVMMSWGSRGTCILNIGDGINIYTGPCDQDNVYSVTQRFNNVGVFYPFVNASNTVSSVYTASSLGPIYVQVPVSGYSIRCAISNCEDKIGPPFTSSYELEVSFSLLFDKSAEKPTNASYYIDFGDGTVTSTSDMFVNYSTSYNKWNYLVFDFGHEYKRGGNYSVTVTIWNLVSRVDYVIKHDIFEELRNLDFQGFDVDPVSGIANPGGGTSLDYFALEHDVKFVSSHSRGSHVHYQWDFGDTSTYSVYYADTATHRYTEDLSFTVELTATNYFGNNVRWNNKMSELTISKTIHIQRGCWGIALSVNDPRSKNTSFDYQMDPGTIGTDACYFIDFVDKTSVPSQYLMFGDSQQCSEVSEWGFHWNSPGRNYFQMDSDFWKTNYSNKTSNNITVSNSFMWQGVYNAKLECKNKVSHESYTYRTRVTKGPCWWPYVNLTRPNQCFTPMCDSNKVKKHYKSERLVVSSDVIINCTATNISVYTWKIFKLDENFGNETEINGSSLGNADLQSIGARILILDSKYLEYGLYRFELNVSMEEEMGMFTYDTVQIRVVPTPLVVQISGGSLQKKKWGMPVTLDGITLTYDPDLLQGDKTGMTFIWLCRRLCETWPEFDENFDVVSPMTTNCTYTKLDDRGCSKLDGFDSAGKVENETDGTVVMNTFPMYENEKIEVMIIVRKGERQGNASQILNVVEGEPPDVGLQCVTNCAYRMNPDSRYTLKSVIGGWTKGVYFYYRWKLYGVPVGGTFFDRVEIPQELWINNTGTGREGPNMAVEPILELLLDKTLYRSFYFSVKIWRWGTSENLNGISEQSFRINKKPLPGSCDISPKEGYGYETKFHISSSGFTDSDDGNTFTYKFGFFKDSSQPITWLHEGLFPDNTGDESPLPESDEAHNFKHQIIVRAYDQNGAFADAFTEVTVWAPSPEDITDILDNATKPEGIVNNLLVGADIKVASVTNCIAKYLNDEADGASNATTVETTTMAMNSSNTTTSTADLTAAALAAKQKRSETREFIMSGFTRIKTPNVEAMQTTAAALASITKKEDELTLTAQESAAEILDKYFYDFSSQSDLSADDREEAATTIMEFIGNTMHACGYTAEKSETDSNNLYSEFMVAQENDGADITTTQSAPTTTLSPAEYKAKQEEILALKDKAKKICLAVQASLNKFLAVISQFKVAGEIDAILESPKLNVTLSKGLTYKLNEEPLFEVGGASSVLMPKLQTIFGASGNESTYMAETEILRMPNNPFTWTNSSESSATKITSDVVTIKFRDENSQEVPVKNNAQEFDIFVDRSNFDTTISSVVNKTTDWGETMVMHTVAIETGNSINVALSHIRDKAEIKRYIDSISRNDTKSDYIANMFEFGTVEFYVFIGIGDTVPTEEEYNFTCQLPLSDAKLAEMMSYLDSVSFENDTSHQRSSYMKNSPDRYTCYLTDVELNLDNKCSCWNKHRVVEVINTTTTTAATTTTTTPTTTTTTPTTTTTTPTTTTTTPTTTTTTPSITTAADGGGGGGGGGWGWGKRRRKRNASKSEKAMNDAEDEMKKAEEEMKDAEEELKNVQEAIADGNMVQAQTAAQNAQRDADKAQEKADRAAEDAAKALQEAKNADDEAKAQQALDYAAQAQTYADQAAQYALQAANLLPATTTTTTTTTTTIPTTTTTTPTTTTTTPTTTTTTTPGTTTTTLPPTTTTPWLGYVSALYSLKIFSVYCVWWNESHSAWSSDGCRVGPLSRPDRVHCLCNHLTAFGAGVAVPMNSINLGDSAFNKLDENPVIFATMLSALCLYLLVLIWARKKDLADKVMAGFSPLPDNDPRDKYLYELTVFTGARKNAGTTAKVSFILTGNKEETPPRFLADEKRPVLQRANVDGFVMAVPKPLGTLTHLRIWHDNMGSNPSWYFSRMQIHDLQTGDKYYFVGEHWLSLDDDDGLIDRIIPIAGRAELTNFSYLFWNKTKHSLTDGHIWFSVFQRPARSSFTRVQRATCCLTLLFCSMLANIAWYQSDSGTSPNEYKLGPITFTLQGLYVGLMASLMAFPVNIIIVCLFRYSKPPPEKKKGKIFALKKDAENSDNEKNISDKEASENQESDVKTPDTEPSENDTLENGSSDNENEKDNMSLASGILDENLLLVKEKSILDADYVEVELGKQKEFLETGDEKQRLMTSPTPPAVFTGSNIKTEAIKVEELEKKDKKPFRLPYWCVYVAYGLAFCSVAVSFWATIEFGGVFGKKKSIEWLISFFISCIESIFFSQPIKVIIIAIFYALVIKKPDTTSGENVDNELMDREEWLHEHMSETDLNDPDKMRQLETMKSAAPLPPELDFVKTAKEERAKELAMYAMLKEVALCMVFLYLCLMIGYTNRDPWSYHLFTTYDNIFNKAMFAGDNYSVHFNEITSYHHFWNWTENALIQGIYNNYWYNGDGQTDSVIQDLNSITVGGARLRQLRIKSEICFYPVNYFAMECLEDYGMFREDIDAYDLRWKKNDTGSSHPAYTYQSGSELDGYPYWGQMATYSGGGYVADLGTDMNGALDLLDTLKQNKWIDKYTKAIFVEINLYNPNHNLWGISMYLLEFLQSGGIQPFPRWHIYRLDRYVGPFMYFVMAIELATIAFVIFYTVKEVRKFRALKKAYFKEFWNVWEMISLLIAYALVLVFIYRAVMSVQITNRIHDNPGKFINMYFTILWDEMSGYFVAILVFMETLRFLRLLRFNRKISLFGSTLMFVGKSTLSFGCIFSIAFMSFAATAYMFFNTVMYDFRNYLTTLETLMSMMLGKFDYTAAYSTTKLAGPLLFGFFCFVFNFILINFFLTILIEGYESVKADIDKQSNEHEVINFMMKKLKFLLGIGQPSQRKRPGYLNDPRKNRYIYIEAKTNDEEKIAELDSKVGNILEKMETFMEITPEEDEDVKQEMEIVKAKKKRKIVIG